MSVRFRPILSAVKAAAMAPSKAPILKSATIVLTIMVEGFPICDSQYLDMTTPDMTPLSYPNNRKPAEHTDVIAVTRGFPWRKSIPVLSLILPVSGESMRS